MTHENIFEDESCDKDYISIPFNFGIRREKRYIEKCKQFSKSLNVVDVLTLTFNFSM